MTKLPLITVIITNYNYGDYVGRAIESVLNQTYNNVKPIVINDGSTDSSDTVIKKYVSKNPDIIYINQKNQGANVSRNKGINMAKGEYIFLLDADNWLDANHIEKMHQTAINTHADVVYSDLQNFGDDTALRAMPEFDIEYLKITNFIDSSALVRRVAIGKNKFDIKLNRKFLQDYDFFLGLALKGLKIVKCPDVKLNYRVHSKQNGLMNQVDKLEKYIENYQYIIKKYKKMYPKEFRATTMLGNDMIKNWIHLRKLVLIKDEQIGDLQQQIGDLQQQNTTIKAEAEELTRLKSSRTWKLRTAAASAINKIRPKK